MKGDRIAVHILSMQLIPNLSPGLRRELGIDSHWRAIGLISSDCDDATYLALDEATKAANVEVIYAKSMYAGAANASTRLAGEVIGVLAGPTPDEVESGLRAAADFLHNGVGFRSADAQDSVVYLSHCVSGSGSYLSGMAHIPAGQALAYLVAPPVEALIGLDAALKASDVEMKVYFAPPTETNFSGGLLTGTQSACEAACEAFSRAVEAVAEMPIKLGGM